MIDLADFGCTNADDNDERFPECFDGIDNDGDGLIDYPADPQCADITDTDEWHPSQCVDGVDNDGDGLVDASDPNCKVFAGFYPLSFDNSEAPECRDNFDNDYDGLIDYPDDTSCTDENDDDEWYLMQCRDGIDNDADGKWDYYNWPHPNNSEYDRSCLYASDNNELGGNNLKYECVDGVDNDGDGLVDANDPGCPWPSFDNTEQNQCKDWYDRDDVNRTFNDGYFAYPYDDGCTSPEDNNEGDPAQCWDGRDNDGDGFIDYGEDPGCVSAFDNDERFQCSDGIDNDDDWSFDYDLIASGYRDDISCASPEDNDELNPTQCADGIDNDGDGKIDYGSDPSNDPGCTSIYDNYEWQPYQCQDGLDNDGDGKIDWDNTPFVGDSECESRDDDNELVKENGYEPFATVFSFFTLTLPVFQQQIIEENQGIFTFIASVFKVITTLFAAEPGPPAVNLSIGEFNLLETDTIDIVTTEAYDTYLNVAWKTTNACSCVGSKSPNNAD